MSAVERTPVGIVGGGPAGLLLSHLLARAGIDSVVLDNRSREEIERTSRAGILEAANARLLVDSGVSDRVLSEGDEHEGIALRFGGASHRIDFAALVGRSVWLYPQTSVFTDLADARARDAGDVRFGVRDVVVADLADPLVRYIDAGGAARELRARVLVGADGSHSTCRRAIPEGARRRFGREYPYAWFGILCQAPPSAPELVYTHSERGFALISQRTPTVQRMYFECDPAEDAAAWSDGRIWDELQSRVAGDDGFTLTEGPITDRAVLTFRSSVSEPMRWRNLLLVGDAAHTVPPTGAKGLNLALADAVVLAECVERAFAAGDLDLLDDYAPRALDRVWRAQHFSYWLTTMLHAVPGGDGFDRRRQLAELAAVTRSEAGSRYLAEGYTGSPSPRR